MRAVVVGGVAVGVEPAVGGEVLSDLALEMMFLMKIHPPLSLPWKKSHEERGLHSVR